MNEENSPESTSANEDENSQLEEGEVRDATGEEEAAEIVAFDNVDELYDSDELPDDEPDDEPDEESEEESEEQDESEDGFSLEALSKAYAKAVAKQNEQIDPESTSEIDFGESRKLENNASEQGSGKEEDSEAIAGESTGQDDNQSDSSVASETADPGQDQLLDEDADNSPCPISPKSILEAMLFVGTPDGSAMKSRHLAAHMRGVSPKEITQLAKELNKEYKQHNSPYRVVRENAGYKMVLDDSMNHVKGKFYGEVKEALLSQPAIDILSVVAYNQPVTSEQIEKIRGKPCGAILLQLVRRQLLMREKTDSKPVKTIYKTTPRFLELFGIEELDDLPRTEDVELFD